MLLLAPDRWSTPRRQPGAGGLHGAGRPGLVLRALFLILLSAQVLNVGLLIVAAVALLWVRHRQAGPGRADPAPLAALGRADLRPDRAGRRGPGRGLSPPSSWTWPSRPSRSSVTIGLLRPDLADVDALVAWTLTSAAVAAVVVVVDLALIAAGSALLEDRLDEREVTLLVLVLAVVGDGPLRAWIGHGVRRVLFGRRSDRYDVVSRWLRGSSRLLGRGAAAGPGRRGRVDVQGQFVRVEVVAPDGGPRSSATHGSEPTRPRCRPSTSPTAAGLAGRSRHLVLGVRVDAVAARPGTPGRPRPAGRDRDPHQPAGERGGGEPRAAGPRPRGRPPSGILPAPPRRSAGAAGRVIVDVAGNAAEPLGAPAEPGAVARTEVADVFYDVLRRHDRPPALDDLGLEAVLRQQAERVRSEVDVTVQAGQLPGAAGGGGRGGRVWIVSEAVTNVVKHAAASRASVALAVDGHTLDVEDQRRRARHR